jgi:hypothetical protein
MVITNLYSGLILDVNQKINLVGKKTNNLHQKIDLAKLPVAKGASFDSHMEEHNAKCLPNTRVEMLRQIMEWAKDREGKPIFWLIGMAGTGKSTIARTVAQSFADNGQLGASFFCKKGEGDRGNATQLFTTIAKDLTAHMPWMGPGISKTCHSGEGAKRPVREVNPPAALRSQPSSFAGLEFSYRTRCAR